MATTPATKTKRPRGGEVWVRCNDGIFVQVRQRTSFNPMAGTRPHLETRWTCVLWNELDDPNAIGFDHESDFVAGHAFVMRTL